MLPVALTEAALPFDDMVDAVCGCDPLGRLVYANESARQLFALGRGTLSGDELSRASSTLRHAVQGTTSDGIARQVETFHPITGRWLRSNVSRTDGRTWVVARDVTAHRIAAARLDILSLATRDADDRTVFETVARHVAEALHDLCVIRLLSSDGAVFDAPMGAWDVEPDARRQLIRSIVAPSSGILDADLVRSGSTVVRTTLPAEAVRTIEDPALRSVVESLQIHTVMLAPIRTEGRLLGVLSVARRRTGTVAAFSEVDRALIDDLASTTSLVVGRALRVRDIMQSRAQFRELVEESPFAVAMFDREMRYLYASRRWVRDYHLPGDSKSLRGKCHYHVFPEIGDAWRAVHRRGLSGEVVSHDAEAFPRSDGSTDWVRWEVRPWREADGAIGGIMIFTEDVTSRMRAEEELRRLEHVFEHASWGMTIATPDHRVIRVNHAFAAMHGTTPEHWVGRPLQEMFADPEHTELPELPARLSDGAGLQYESVHARADGSTFPVLTEVTAFRDPSGRMVYRASNYLDITERLEAREALERQRAELWSLLESAPFAVVVFEGEDHVPRFSNPRHRELTFGRVTLGRPLLESMPELRGSEFLRILDEVFRTGAGRRIGEFPSKLRRGSELVERWLDLTWVPMQTDHTRAVLLYAADVDEHVRARNVRDEFLSIASHELRTPLTALELQLEGVRRTLAKSPPARTERKLELASHQLDRLNVLIEGLLDVSRIATGRFRLELEQVDLAPLVHEVVERFQESARRAGSVLRIEAPAAALGRWDRSRVDQALTNLLTNAIKYGRGQPIDVRLVEESDRVLLSVRDRGIGIRPEDLERIFGRFERAVSSSQYGGLGLGLYITAEIVQAHGGAIDVQSEPGQGATFTIALPR